MLRVLLIYCLIKIILVVLLREKNVNFNNKFAKDK